MQELQMALNNKAITPDNFRNLARELAQKNADKMTKELEPVDLKYLTKKAPQSVNDLPELRKQLEQSDNETSQTLATRLSELQTKRQNGGIDAHESFLNEAQSVYKEIIAAREKIPPDHHQMALDDVGLQYVRFGQEVARIEGNAYSDNLSIQLERAIAQMEFGSRQLLDLARSIQNAI